MIRGCGESQRRRHDEGDGRFNLYHVNLTIWGLA